MKAHGDFIALGNGQARPLQIYRSVFPLETLKKTNATKTEFLIYIPSLVELLPRRLNCPPNILIVEHERGAALEIRETLKGMGFSETCFALSATEALEVVHQGKADIVLIDVKLPGDIDLADEIASRYRLPVLYLTATADPSVLDRVNVSNLFGYLVKPVEVRELRAVLELAIESWRERSTKSSPSIPSQWEEVFSSIGEPFFSIDGDWRLTFANEHALRYFGLGRERALGRVFWDLIPEGTQNRQYNEYYKAITRQQTRSFEIHDEAKGQWMEARVYPNQDGLVVLLRDVTERKISQEKEMRLEKLEGLGLLARGFAHDFNNLLTILLGNLSLATVKAPDREYEEALMGARQATLQAQNLVQQLLTFAKGGAPIKEWIELNSLIREIVENRQRRAHIEYRVQLAPHAIPTEVDKSQFRRLLENLVQNSEEAMPTGGVVTVSTGIFDREHPPVTKLPNLDPNTQYIVIEVHDNGEGIPVMSLDKIFEPYYSTRSGANATGIGLTVCDSIARSHQGFLAVESHIGSHTKVCLFLPETKRHRESQTARPRPGRASTGEPKRILVLEDDKAIRTLISMALKKSGYVVHETEEGSQTVEAYRRANEEGVPFDLVITDLSIPDGMSGVEAIKQIRRIDPTVTAVVSSGYSDDPVMAKHREYGFAAVLPKPYEPTALGRLVREILEAAAAERAISVSSSKA